MIAKEYLSKVAERVGLKVFDFVYLLQEPDLKRDLLLFDRLAIDPTQLRQAWEFAGSVAIVYGKGPDKASARWTRTLSS